MRGLSGITHRERVCRHDKTMSEAKRLWRAGCAQRRTLERRGMAGTYKQDCHIEVNAVR